ncbi:hypothetical protein Pmani_018328 [Petrolisthes manimaculis]|uniref:G-protein coupled receptors family 1 profile domain-containing protein n=1 Tax=Petrolisthes manimaculis TaxID=1843537 RepID=A0AAE1PMN8_9EUCA|nr:hypothetical protein Pmani_018328 [Petrolisthes manimaculis]
MGTTQDPTLDERGEDYRNSALAVVEVVVLAVILMVAVVGNMFVLIAVWRHSAYRPMSRCYLFMLHLSLADILVAIFNIFPQLVWDITYRFQGPDILCRLVKYAQVYVLYVSTYMLVFMAVDRARAVQGSGRGSLRAARLMIGGAWMVGLVLAAPQTVLFSLREVEPGVQDCWVVFQLISERLYVTWFVVSVFFLPWAIIVLCYSYICWAVWHSAGTTTSLSAIRKRLHLGCIKSQGGHRQDDDGHLTLELQPVTSSEQQQLQRPHLSAVNCAVNCPIVTKVSAAKLKTVRMTLTVVLAFTLCWMPYCVAQLHHVYNKPKDCVLRSPSPPQLYPHRSRIPKTFPPEEWHVQ